MRASLWNSLLNQAGGLPYHVRAARYRDTWRPFRAELAKWLEGWKPVEKHLALVGPSAGYNLPWVQLARYDVLTVFEPDPVACWLFARNIRRALGTRAPRVDFVRADHLVAHSESLIAFLEREHVAVLFCNVLGQLVHLLPEHDVQSRMAAIRRRVHRMLALGSWASFHDRVSGSIEPKRSMFAASKRWSDAELVSHAYDVTGRTTLVELTDHHTEGFFPSTVAHVYFSWQLEPGAYHLIEGVHS